jgi:signal recognition particle receptor subunit beta
VMDALKQELTADAAAVEHAVEAGIEKIVHTATTTNRTTTAMLLPIIITLALILLGAYLMGKHKLITSSRRTFIICGSQGVGKTHLFHLLTSGKLPLMTVSSLEPQSAELLLGEEYREHATFRGVEIVDFPANKKLKSLYLTPYFSEKLHEVQGIVYMVDASAFDAKACHAAAEDLLEILNVTEGKPGGIDLMIVANKDDLFTSKKPAKIKSMLEEEIAKIHDLKLRGLGKVDATDATGAAEVVDNLDLAMSNGKFQFQLLEGNVEFCSGNIFKEKSGFPPLEHWIYQKIVN